jgi:hypothetical protein
MLQHPHPNRDLSERQALPDLRLRDLQQMQHLRLSLPAASDQLLLLRMLLPLLLMRLKIPQGEAVVAQSPCLGVAPAVVHAAAAAAAAADLALLLLAS